MKTILQTMLPGILLVGTAFPVAGAEGFLGAPPRSRRTSGTAISFLLCLLLGVVLLVGTPALALPEGFEDQGVARVRKIIDVAFGTHSDGTQLVYGVTKPGFVHVLTNFEMDGSEPTNEIALDLSTKICDDRERGIGGVELHPNFQQNGYIYLFYSLKRGGGCEYDEDDGPVNRCSRWTVRDDYSIDPNSEEIIFQTKPTLESIHNGGDMAFGVDGMLYVTLGDDGQRSDAFAQDLSHLFGKMLRITDGGGVPSDNPFTGPGTAPCAEKGRIPDGYPSNTTCQEIFAYGLRNPFRFAMDPHSTDKVRFLINDVGAKVWEETSVGGADYVGVNYGWPEVEGPCNYARDDECPVYEEFEDPIFWYEHNSAKEGAAVGIAVVPPGTNWPQEYHRSFFVAEYTDGIIFHMKEDPQNYCRECIPPRHGYEVTEFFVYEKPVGLKFGPYQNNLQALYYTERSGDVNLRRIVYKGSSNTAPVADFTMSKSIVPVGDKVGFDASESFDPDQESLTYEWNFGDGSAVASGKVVEHTFQAAGTYEVTLTIKDAGGFTNSHRETVTVGDPPVVQILNPPPETHFAVGDKFTVQGSGTDANGNPLESSALEWEVRQHHGTHFHPFFSGKGETAELPAAPAPEDFLAATNSYLEVLLTGTDSLGLSTTVSQNIIPKTAWLDFDTIPTNLEILLEDEEIVTPRRVLSWENHKLHVQAPDQGNFVFVSWSNGMSQTGRLAVPTGISGTQEVPSYVATFQSNLPTQSPTSMPTASPVASPTGSPTASPTTSPVASPTARPTAEPTKFISRTDSGDDDPSVGIGTTADDKGNVQFTASAAETTTCFGRSMKLIIGMHVAAFVWAVL